MSQRGPWGGVVAGPGIVDDGPVGALTTQRVANNLLHWHDQSGQVLASGVGSEWLTINQPSPIGSGWISTFPLVGPFWVRVRQDGESFRVRIKARAFSNIVGSELYAIVHPVGEIVQSLSDLSQTNIAKWDIPAADPGTWMADPEVDPMGVTGDTIWLENAAEAAGAVSTLKEAAGDVSRLASPRVQLSLVVRGDAASLSVTLRDFYAAEVAD